MAEAFTHAEKSGEGFYEAERHRLKGELLLAQEVLRPQAKGSREKTEEAEGCFLRAIEIARQQQAKSLELRAVMSLVRLQQQQTTQRAIRNTQYGSRTTLAEAHRMLSDAYHWFTEGFETKDLREAQALLAALA